MKEHYNKALHTMYNNNIPTNKNRAYQLNRQNSWKSVPEDNIGNLQEDQEEQPYAIRSTQTKKTLPATITTQSTQLNTPTIANSTIWTNILDNKIHSVIDEAIGARLLKQLEPFN